MPQLKNVTIGYCKCRRNCDQVADVRRSKNHESGARYLDCPLHGVDRAQGATQQKHMDEWIDTHQVPEKPEIKPKPKAETKPEKKPEPSPKQSDNDDFLSTADKQLDDFMG